MLYYADVPPMHQSRVASVYYAAQNGNAKW